MSDLGMKHDDRHRLLKALFLEAVQRRQNSGERTALRDLHDLLDIPQPVALRVAQELEDEGVLTVDRNTADAFGSLVSVPLSVTSAWQKIAGVWNPAKR